MSLRSIFIGPQCRAALRLTAAWLAALALLWQCGGVAQAQITGPTGTLVRMNYEGFGEVYIDLFDELTPVTAANFMQYINTDRFDNSIIHRVDHGVGVIQGGGFNTNFQPIQTYPLIPLEYDRVNTRGTISMARFFDSTNPPNTTTASSQFFINLKDNTSVLGPANNGGYAVFGWVVGPGMGVVDNIAGVDTFDIRSRFTPPNGGAFGQVPLDNFTQTDLQTGVDHVPHAVRLTSVEVIREHAAFQNPFLRGDINNDGLLRASDVLAVIDELNAEGSYEFDSPFAGGLYYDVTGDGRFSPADLARVISDVILAAGAESQVATPLAAPLAAPLRMAGPLTVVPEPASWCLGAAGLLAFAGLAARARQRATRHRTR